MSTSDKNWIVASGQAWKLYLSLTGFVGSLACFTLALYSLATGGDRFAAFTSCGLFLGVMTFLWMILALRCPHCMNKLVWTMVGTRPHSSWIIDLAALQRCPVCGRELTN